jgi:hypothetical protein
MDIAKYNIKSVGNSRFLLGDSNLDNGDNELVSTWGLFMETTLITGLHTLSGFGYEVSATEAKNIHRGDAAED